ncbi:MULTISPECIES: ATP-dependent DNA helicase [Oxalobacteraceae]|uniref:ATP-dependent DNA helicase n=1 Tax=Herminiimonas sp. Marseille-P9896 TaxID=2742211 RepID=UPI0015884901|nr:MULTISPECIES: ATP-dependent DNA helicase [Oxalobacteraceae]
MSYVVAVRTLCEFAAKVGDLDLRFTPAPTAQQGIAGHGTVVSRRGKHYEAEVSLSGLYKQLRVRGRADGYDPGYNRVEEFKTFRGDLHAIPDNHRQLHWAQVKVYAWLLCQTRGLKEINVALVYFDIGTQKETMLVEKHSADALELHFDHLCERFVAWAEQETQHRLARDTALTGLAFPHAEFRPGQRHLAESVYKAALSGRHLMAQAPTGIGKTVATIFPLLKASPGQKLDKIFFLAAKTPGRALALDAMELIGKGKDSAVLPLRVLELVARDKACEHPDKACHGESCPLAQGFYDRVVAARQAAVRAAVLDQQALRAIALAHQVCPYYLSQELVRWSDVVVGDYNYYFDISAMLYGLTVENDWRVAVLVDEAHNMVGRARKMYSAELTQSSFRYARKSAPKSLKTVLDRVNRQWNDLYRNQEAEYAVYHAIAEKFLFALQQAGTDITDLMTDEPDSVSPELQRFYFDAMQFSKLAEVFGEHSMFDITTDMSGPKPQATLCIRNIVPAPFLKQRFATAHTATLFSATLGPHHFYSDMLGLPDDTAWIDVESPFMAQQLSVRIARTISTRYQHRSHSLAPIAKLIAAQYSHTPGNYMAFFSSFDYLQQVLDLFAELYPDVTIWQQSRGMGEGEKQDFLARFTDGGQGIGFAVLGGAFAEGVDLPGERLIGAFVATLGLPQMNPINEEMRVRMDQIFGKGYDYTYLYPGMQKVVQAAGRVIRTQDDRGYIHLIDDRFARPDVMDLLPAWWQVQ